MTDFRHRLFRSVDRACQLDLRCHNLQPTTVIRRIHQVVHLCVCVNLAQINSFQVNRVSYPCVHIVWLAYTSGRGHKYGSHGLLPKGIILQLHQAHYRRGLPRTTFWSVAAEVKLATAVVCIQSTNPMLTRIVSWLRLIRGLSLIYPPSLNFTRPTIQPRIGGFCVVTTDRYVSINHQHFDLIGTNLSPLKKNYITMKIIFIN